MGSYTILVGSCRHLEQVFRLQLILHGTLGALKSAYGILYNLGWIFKPFRVRFSSFTDLAWISEALKGRLE
jgi:hypothetical protein